MADKQESGMNIFSPTSWLFDSGAHIVNDLSLFTTLVTDKITATVQIPNGSHVAVRAIHDMDKIIQGLLCVLFIITKVFLYLFLTNGVIFGVFYHQ